MLLACSSDGTSAAVDAMQYLLQEGAVPDTWAPNGSSVSVASVYVRAAMHMMFLPAEDIHFCRFFSAYAYSYRSFDVC